MAQTETEILDSLIPQAVVESVTFESNRSGDENGIVMKVVYLLSDVVEGDAISQWFDQVSYEKYFQVRVELRADGVLDTQYDTPALSTNSESAAGNLIETSDNGRISSFRFEETYNLPTEPEDLSFTVVTSFDIFSLERDFEIDLFRAEQRDTERSERLVIIENKNLLYPIQDFRIREELQKFEMSTERFEDFDSLSRQVSVKKALDEDNANDFMSDFWLTRNAQGEAKFMFIFNAASFFEKRSKYRDIFKRLNAMEKFTLIRDISIPSLKVTRKRVKVLQNKRGREVIDFKDELDIQEVIETGKMPSQSTFSRKVTANGSIMQVSITGVSQNPLDDNNLIFITGTDYTIANATDGAYCYGVSIEAIDTTRTMLLERLSGLNERISLMKSILSASLRPECYNLQTDLYKKGLEEIVSYDSDVTKFKSAKNLVKRAYRTFIGELSAHNSSMINKLFRMDSIKSPKELEMLIEVMEKLLSNSLMVIGESSEHTSGQSSPTASDIRIVAEKFYTSPSKVFDANVPKLQGMEYLSNFGTNTQEEVIREITSLSNRSSDIGLRVIDGGEWEGRIEDEIGKFFESGTQEVSIPVLNSTPGNSNISLTGTGSEFLTVAAMLQSDSNVSIFNGINDTTASASIIRNDSLRGLNSRLAGTPELASLDSRPSANYLAKSGVAFSDIKKEPLGRRRSLTADALRARINDEGTDERENQENFEDYIFDKVSRQRRSSLATTNIVSAASLRDTTAMQASALSNLSPRQQREEYENAPNQTISYATLEGDLNEAAFVVSSEFLTKISYLSGFTHGESGENIGNPEWKDLSLDIYRNNSERNLLCRIKPYHKDLLGIRSTSQSPLPIYDAYFIIRPESNFVYEATEMVDTTLRMTEETRQRNSEIARLRQLLSRRTEALTSLTEDRIIYVLEMERVDTQIQEIEEEVQMSFGTGRAREAYLRTISSKNSLIRQKFAVVGYIQETDRLIDNAEESAALIRTKIRETQSETN